MTASVDGLRLRHVLGRDQWSPPCPFGPDGWCIRRADHTAAIIVSVAPVGNTQWIHASVSRPERLPTYEDLVLLHRAVFGAGWAYQVFAPEAEHVNLHEYCLHLWGRLDGHPVFAMNGSI